MFTALRLSILVGTISLIAIGSAHPQIHYDSGYTWRAYTGTTEPTCPNKLCHRYPMHPWDSYYTEFTAWKSLNGNPNSANTFLNFRVIFPPGYNINDNSRKYPLIVMFHGAGESGRVWTGYYNYAYDDPRFDNNGDNLRYGGDEHRIAVAKAASDPKAFPGIVVFPQSRNSANWGDPQSSTLNDDEELLLGFIEEQLVARYHADINKIVIHGLSNGAKGLWTLVQKRPDLFAAILPMSGLPFDPDKASTILLTTPIRLFQGGTDINPSPDAAETVVDAFEAKGGNLRLFLYSDLGHGTWLRAYKEPDFFSWILAQDKRKVYVFGGSLEVCGDDPLRLGFSANMMSYQWTRGGKDITGALGRYLENVNMVGTYTVKFQRPNGQWDESLPVNTVMKPGCTVVTGINKDSLFLSENNGQAALYPNPTKGKVVIALEEVFEPSSIQVISVMGQSVQVRARQISERSVELDLTESSAGLYLLRINGYGRVFRVVKE